MILRVVIFVACLMVYCHPSNRYLIVSIDNRDFDSNLESADYVTVTAILNANYAKYHGYDFLEVKVPIGDLEQRVSAKYKPMHDEAMTVNAVKKNQASAYNVHLNQYRGATWAKVPALWHVIDSVGFKYDWILYIDSDAAISPLRRNRTIPQVIEDWKNNPTISNSSIMRGQLNISQSAFIFFSNHPWRDDMPCTGAILIQPQLAEPMLREWWDFNIPMKNFIHFHEQDALWHMLDSPNYGFLINDSTVTIMAERQFPSVWTRYRDLWVCHVASYNHMVRRPIFQTFLSTVDCASQQSYEVAVKEVLHNNMMTFDMLDTCERMNAKTISQLALTGAKRRTDFPQHSLDTQELFYGKHRSSESQAAMPPVLRHEGDLVAWKRGREIFLVQNGSKRSFPNWDTFVVMGHSQHSVFRLESEDMDRIPNGPSLPALDARRRKKRSRRLSV